MVELVNYLSSNKSGGENINATAEIRRVGRLFLLRFFLIFARYILVYIIYIIKSSFGS